MKNLIVAPYLTKLERNNMVRSEIIRLVTAEQSLPENKFTILIQCNRQVPKLMPSLNTS